MKTLLLACAFVSTAACHASYPTSPTDPVPVALQVHYTRALGYAAVGVTYSFVAYTVTAEGAYQDVTSSVTWASSDPQVFRLAATNPGWFTAVAPGVADVIARYKEFTSSLPVAAIRTDRVPYPSLSISPGDPQLIGQSAQAALRWQETATVSTVVTNVATWTSSDPGIVTVDGGRVTAVAPGTAQIRASYNGITAWYGLSVAPRR